MFYLSFLEGSQVVGCFIEYKCIRTDLNGNITIVRSSVDANTASKCVTGIYTSNYNVTFYDMDYNNVPYTTEYAVKLTNQLVNGLSPILTITSTPRTSSSMTVNSVSQSPTTLCKDCDNSKLLLILSSQFVHIIVGTVKRYHLVIICKLFY